MGTAEAGGKQGADVAGAVGETAGGQDVGSAGGKWCECAGAAEDADKRARRWALCRVSAAWAWQVQSGTACRWVRWLRSTSGQGGGRCKLGVGNGVAPRNLSAVMEAARWLRRRRLASGGGWRASVARGAGVVGERCSVFYVCVEL